MDHVESERCQLSMRQLVLLETRFCRALHIDLATPNVGEGTMGASGVNLTFGGYEALAQVQDDGVEARLVRNEKCKQG